jgi:hypothetical protein
MSTSPFPTAPQGQGGTNAFEQNQLQGEKPACQEIQQHDAQGGNKNSANGQR